nr:subtilisin-like protease 3 [Quercus suber]
MQGTTYVHQMYPTGWVPNMVPHALSPIGRTQAARNDVPNLTCADIAVSANDLQQAALSVPRCAVLLLLYRLAIGRYCVVAGVPLIMTSEGQHVSEDASCISAATLPFQHLVLTMYFLCILALLTCLTARALSSEYGDLLAPLEGMDNQDKYPNEYLIQFYNNHTLEQHFHIIGQNLSSSPEFRRYTFGYQATIDEKTRDEQVRRDPGVRMVEANSPLYWVEPEDVVVFDHPQLLYNQTSHLHKRAYHTVIQENAPYGLQMITTPSERFDIPIMDEGSYEYLASAGLGVQVYVLDTGIRTTHTLLGGRARHFGGLGPNDISPYTDATMADVRGHVGAEVYGVAPHVSLINVKVVDNSGLVRDPGRVAQALIDITAEHIRNKKKAKSDPNPWNFRGSVINMSFTWLNHGSAVLYQLIAANAAGISVFGAAGNQNEDYGDRYPCANVQTRCIAAVDATYNKWKASNYGSTINFVAPGKNILSLHSSSDSKVARMSGTSMASPHAAGAAAIFASVSPYPEPTIVSNGD